MLFFHIINPSLTDGWILTSFCFFALSIAHNVKFDILKNFNKSDLLRPHVCYWWAFEFSIRYNVLGLAIPVPFNRGSYLIEFTRYNFGQAEEYSFFISGLRYNGGLLFSQS